MKTPTSITTPAQFIASLPAERQSTVQALHDLIIKNAPTLTPLLVSGMLGFGAHHYKYASGREGDTAFILVASQKNHLSVYLCVSDDKGYLAEQNAARLGKVSVGKSCIRFKKLEDLNLEGFTDVVKQAAKLAKKPGAFGM